ncbi:MAG: hypothetical protein KDA96_09590 [Planctomycetaceae bacterium]|nr:hypothetical protein [Planctomycetaceae bacterium]
MKRIGLLICLIAALRIPWESGSLPGLATSVSAGPSESDAPVGIRATYRVTYANPSQSQLVTVWITYYVTRDEWLGYIQWMSPHWVSPPFSPYPVDGTIYRSSTELECRWQSLDTLTVTDVGRERLRNETFQGYPSTEMVHARKEAAVWRLPPAIVEALNSQPKTPQTIHGAVTVPSGADVLSEVRIENDQESGLTIHQTLNETHKRVQSGFRQFSVGGTSCLAAGTCAIETHGDHFAEFYEIPETGLVGDHDRHDEDGLPFYRGARFVRLDWESTESTIVPRSIIVTLGDDAEGMHLRSAQLIELEQQEEAVTVAKIQSLREHKPGTSRLATAGLKLGVRFWMKHSSELTEEDERFASEAVSTVNQWLEDQPYLGERLGFRNHLVRVAVVTDVTPDHSVFAEALDNYLAELQLASPESVQITDLYNLAEMLRAWKRPDLEVICIKRLEGIFDRLPWDQRVRLCMENYGDVFTRDIAAYMTLYVLKPHSGDSVTPLILHAGMEIAEARLRNALHFFRKAEDPLNPGQAYLSNEILSNLNSILADPQLHQMAGADSAFDGLRSLEKTYAAELAGK